MVIVLHKSASEMVFAQTTFVGLCSADLAVTVTEKWLSYLQADEFAGK